MMKSESSQTSIDSNKADTFKAEKGSKDTVKIVHTLH